MRYLHALALVPSLAGAEPWEGIWTADPEWCVNADAIGEVTPAPIRITATEYQGYENFCEIAVVTPLEGTSAYYAELECFAEGDSYDERRIWMVDAHAPVLWVWFGTDAPLRFEACS